MNVSTTKEPAVPGGSRKVRPMIITLRPSASKSLQEIKLIGPPLSRPREQSGNIHRTSVYSVTQMPSVNSLAYLSNPDSAVLLPSRKIPRPPNAFMIFANEWRKQLALQHPTESNKSISVRLGQLWKNMTKSAKEVYYQRSREAGQDHKQKYPGYVYNPKEARMRKALRDQSRGSRNTSAEPAPARWTKYALTMNHHRQPLVTPVLHLPQQQQLQLCSEDSKASLFEQADRDNNMLQSYPDYLDIPYSIPSNDYNSLDNQSWYPYLQPATQSNGSYMGRSTEDKMPVDWTTPYSSEQGNFIRASPHTSPYSVQNHQDVNPMLMNGGEHSSSSIPEQTAPCEGSCISADCKPIIDQVICQSNDCNVIKDQEQQVKQLLASAKVVPEGSPMLNGGTVTKQEDANSTRLPGFHQAFGSTEIGRFSQPDGFFEAAVAAENERKQTCDVPELTLSYSPNSYFLPFPKTEPDLFEFQDQEDMCFTISPSQFNEPNHLYTLDDSLYNFDHSLIEVDQSIVKIEDSTPDYREFEAQDLTGVANVGKPPKIISENDKCCVVQLESSAIDDNVKEYFSL